MVMKMHTKDFYLITYLSEIIMNNLIQHLCPQGFFKTSLLYTSLMNIFIYPAYTPGNFPSHN